MTDIARPDLIKSIKVILKNADLDNLSAKKVRKSLEAEYLRDLSERKEEIDKLVMELITAADGSDEEEKKKKISNGNASKKKPPSPKKETVSPKKEELKEEEEDIKKYEEESDGSDIGEIEDYTPIAKKFKSSKKTPKSDEELAKRLQAEEEDNDRPSRRCKVVKKAAPKRKSGGGPAKGTSTYSRECSILSPLSDFLETDKMSRPMLVKKMWEIVKGRDLLDPKNKQFMICDDELLKIFGKKKIRMFGMMKHLKQYIQDLPRE